MKFLNSKKSKVILGVFVECIVILQLLVFHYILFLFFVILTPLQVLPLC